MSQRPTRARAKPRSAAPGKADDESPILQRLGARVRTRRQELSLTLRELGARSDVSERFLVLLESGRANVSVGRLADIAGALGTTASDLLADDGERTASAPPSGRAPLVALLGLRGAGKTAIGARAATRLGLPFVELDARIAERAGMSLGELFELHGDTYYRRLEREELDRLLRSSDGAVVATGGSLVTDPTTFGRLREAALTIWLRASADDHWSRVIAQGDARPMANRTDAMQELRALLRSRRPLYGLADHVVDTSSLGLTRSIDRVVKLARGACSKTTPPSA